MNNLIDSFAANTIAVVLAAAVPNIAGAFEKAPLDPVQVGKTAGVIVSAEKETNSQHRAKINVMLKGYDPVAYFKEGRAVRGKRSISSTHNGVTYFFASETDKADFDQNPKKFEPQYGGFCANSVAHGRKSDSDPNAFFIYKGKLYVCSTPAAKAEFTSNPDANISRANDNWLKMGPATYNSQTRGFDEPWPFGPESTQQ